MYSHHDQKLGSEGGGGGGGDQLYETLILVTCFMQSGI